MLWFTVLAFWWCASGCGAVPARDKPFYPATAHAQHFAAFKFTYNKQYATPEEERHRFNAFKKNLATINELNANDKHAIYDINEFADETDEELEASYTNDSRINNITNCRTKIVSENDISAIVNIPESFDWRDKGLVTKVKDQKECNAGYAFAHVGTVEGKYAMKHNKLIEFSTQQIIDCDEFDSGCKGGYSLYACGYLGINGFIKEEDYKYVGSQGKCAYDKKKVLGHYDVCLIVDDDEKEITKVLIEEGPLAAQIDNQALRFYRSGVVTQCTFKGYNNELLVTGYGSEKGLPYWSLKNSKGENWGEKGYVRIKRGVHCLGIAIGGKESMSTVYFK